MRSLLFLVSGLLIGLLLGELIGYHYGSSFKAVQALALQSSPIPPAAVMPSTPAHIYFSGQFKKQGAYELPAGEQLTLLHAIIMYGGFADFADTRHVQIMRPDGTGHSQKIVVDVADVLNGNLDRDPVLQADDVVSAPQKLVNF